jgi:hypothetical protein
VGAGVYAWTEVSDGTEIAGSVGRVPVAQVATGVALAVLEAAVSSWGTEAAVASCE